MNDFIFQPTRYDDGSGSDHWFSGLYKITKYEAWKTEWRSSKEKYGAYYKPTGWLNWGMCVETTTFFYPTLADAQAACHRHATIGDYTYHDDEHQRRRTV